MQIEFPSILLPPDITSGSIVDINVAQNNAKEAVAHKEFRALQDQIYNSFGAEEPTTPSLICRNATQTSVVLEWEPINLATASLISLSLYRNGQKAGNIPRPLSMHSTKISGLAVDTEYTFHLVLRTSAGTFASDRVTVRTHKMTDLSGVTITTGILPPSIKDSLTQAVERIGAKIVDGVRIDTTHFVTTEGRGQAWEKAVEQNIPVVRPEWVDHCEKSGRILGVTKFYLDAMRPGPVSEEQAPPAASPVAPRTAPAPAPAPETTPSKEESKAGEADAKEPGVAKKDNASGDETKSDEDEDEDEDDEDEAEQKVKAESEPKARAPEQEEQKVRLEDKEEHQVALRSKQEDAEKDGNSDEEDDDDDEDKADRDGKKSATTPDAASFQDVAL